MKKYISTKYIFLLFLILCIVGSILPIYAGYQCIILQDYDAFYALLDNPWITHVYFVRIVLANFNYLQVNVFSFLYRLLTQMAPFNILMVVLVSYLWAANKETYMKTRNRWVIGIITIYGFTYMAIGVYILSNFSITSGYAILSIFRVVGILLILGHGLIMIGSVTYLLQQKKRIYEHT